MNNKPANRSNVTSPRSEPGLGDDIPCSRCGSELDTGLECTECGHDMRPEIYPAAQSLPAVPAEVSEAPGLLKAARYLDDKRSDFDYEHSVVDWETGAREYGTGTKGEAAEEYSNTLAELADELRALATTPQAVQQEVPVCPACNGDGRGYPENCPACDGEGTASQPQAPAAGGEPHGYLYDWTHCPVDKPEQEFTSFVKTLEEAQWRPSNRNIRPVYTAPQPSPHRLTDEQLYDAWTARGCEPERWLFNDIAKVVQDAMLAAAPPAVLDARDGKRLDFLCGDGEQNRMIERENGVWRVYKDVAPAENVHPLFAGITDRWYPTPREAIDAAITKETP
jgi:hypothetical protein